MISGPLTRKDRIASIDVLRGLALFGILIVNAAYFGLPLSEVMSGIDSSDPVGDRITWVLVKVFAEFKFISIFSLLFGFGLLFFCVKFFLCVKTNFRTTIHSPIASDTRAFSWAVGR